MVYSNVEYFLDTFVLWFKFVSRTNLVISSKTRNTRGGVNPYVKSGMCEFNDLSNPNLADDAFLAHFYGQFLADDVF